jgi:hypothetical protein
MSSSGCVASFVSYNLIQSFFFRQKHSNHGYQSTGMAYSDPLVTQAQAHLPLVASYKAVQSGDSHN